MLIAYLTGQRVSDNLEITLDDIHGGAIWFAQNKTDTRLRVELRAELASLITKIT